MSENKKSAPKFSESNRNKPNKWLYSLQQTLIYFPCVYKKKMSSWADKKRTKKSERTHILKVLMKYFVYEWINDLFISLGMNFPFDGWKKPDWITQNIYFELIQIPLNEVFNFKYHRESYERNGFNGIFINFLLMWVAAF